MEELLAKSNTPHVVNSRNVPPVKVCLSFGRVYQCLDRDLEYPDFEYPIQEFHFFYFLECIEYWEIGIFEVSSSDP